MLDPIVQSAFVVIVAWLLTLLANWLNFPVDEATITSIAVALVAFILSKIFPPAVRGFLQKRGFLK